jgi:lysophospholipase L1-like esterase
LAKKLPTSLAAVIWIVTGAACVAAATAVYLQAGNTLVRNGRWVSSKLSLERYVPGAIRAVTQREALRHDRLNLGAWHGFQELIAAQIDDYRTIEFDFLLPSSSYFTLIFNKDAAGFSGIRLSRDGSRPSAFLSASNEGEFLEVRPLRNVERGAWYHARLELAGGEAALFLNGEDWGRFAVPWKKASRFGFRGSNRDSFIDNVAARNVGGATVVQENFSSTLGIGACILASALILGMIQWIVQLLSSGSMTRTLLRGSVISGLLAIVFVRVYFADPAGIRPMYPDSSRFSIYRDGVDLNELVVASIRARYRQPSSRQRRILFLGNSQTQGLGARYLEDGMIERIERKLNATGRRYECINGAVIGSSSRVMLEILKSEWQRLEPSLVVLNFSDDSENALGRLVPDLVEMIRFARSKGVETLLVLAANEPLSVRARLDENHRAVREVGAAESVEAVDLHAFLEQRQDSGFLWWDQTHLTSYGQRLAADYLAPLIARRLDAK